MVGQQKQRNTKLPRSKEGKKKKSEAKQRYLAKKAKKHRKLAKAKRHAAPKDKFYPPGEVKEDAQPSSQLNYGSRAETSHHASHNADTGINAEAGSSKVLCGKIEPSENLTLSKVAEAEEVDEELDEAVLREKRKREKREKRENRDKDEKRARKEARRKAKAKSEAAASEDIGDAAQALSPNEVEAVFGRSPLIPETMLDRIDDADLIDRIDSPILEAFPLPEPPPIPDAALLARQGLPAGLENAQIVDQNLRIGLDEINLAPGPSSSTSTGVGDVMKAKLQESGIEDFFAVQAALLPRLMPLPLVPPPYSTMDDYLISAPTGSGKTLAYALPIVHILSTRVVTRLRALIVLPTKDLVVQVRETLEALAKGTGLQIGSITGSHSFSHEQNMLVADSKTKLLGGSSKLDILIATPGRLIDHLRETPSFTLQHLRFLVIDEADRLLNQSYHDWLAQVLSYIETPSSAPLGTSDLVSGDAVARAWQPKLFGITDTSAVTRTTCQKLLFSATLTRDPAAIASLHLQNPQYIIVQSSHAVDISVGLETFAIPDTLLEQYTVITASQKPLALIRLLHHPDLDLGSALVFTKSVESVTRLAKLLELFGEARQKVSTSDKSVTARAYTNEMKPGERKSLLADFSAGKVQVLVCSDLIARGMDLPSVSHVISYDTPMDMPKYVHRVGRTARAGRAGSAWTLVEKQEALHFKAMMKTAGRERAVKKNRLKDDDLQPYEDLYGAAMRKLRTLYGRDA